MKFENKGKWVKQINESIQRRNEEDFIEDELDKVDEEQINEVRYIDPSNLDKYDKDEIEEVTTSSGEKRYRRKQGAGSQLAKAEPKNNSQSSFNFNNANDELAKELKKSDEDEWYTSEKNKHYAALAKFARDGKAFYEWSKQNLASGEPEGFTDFMIKSGMYDEMKKAELTKKQQQDIIDRLSTRALGYRNSYNRDGKI